MKNANPFHTIFALVGWGLALALALFQAAEKSPPVPVATARAAVINPDLHQDQVSSVLDVAREHLLRRQPQKALEEIAYAFSLCRARDQQPPVAAYELFVDALSQSMALAQPSLAPNKPTSGKLSASSEASKKTLLATKAVANSAPFDIGLTAPPPPAPTVAPQPEAEPSRPNPTRPNFSLPQPSYPTAKRSGSSCPPPPPEPDWSHEPPPRAPQTAQDAPSLPPDFPLPPTGMQPPRFPPGQQPPQGGGRRRGGRSSSYPGPSTDDSLPPFPRPTGTSFPRGY